jgi:hypothetical protein
MKRLARPLLWCLATVLATCAVAATTVVVADTWTINGTAGDDFMDGHDGVDIFRGLGGSDVLQGHGDGDFLHGGVPSGDILRGMENGDELHNGDGYANDTGNCGAGQNDVLYHDKGADSTDGSCESVFDE